MFTDFASAILDLHLIASSLSKNKFNEFFNFV